MKAVVRPLRDAELGWAIAATFAVALGAVALTGWTSMDYWPIAIALLVFTVLWVLADVLLPMNWAHLGHVVITAVGMTVMFSMLGGFVSPAAVLTAIFVGLLMMLAFVGWLRLVAALLLGLGLLVVALLTQPEVRFALPMLASLVNQFLPAGEWQMQVRELPNGGHTLLFMLMFVALLPVYTRIVTVLGRGSTSLTADSKQAQSFVMQHVPAAVLNSSQQVIGFTDIFARLTGVERSSPLERVVTVDEQLGLHPQSIRSSLVTDSVGLTRDGKWLRLQAEQVSEVRTVLNLAPLGTADVARCMIEADSRACIACWADGEVVYFNTAAAQLLPVMRPGSNIKDLLPGQASDRPAAMADYLDHGEQGVRTLDGRALQIRSAPIQLVGQHVLTTLWIEP